MIRSLFIAAALSLPVLAAPQFALAQNQDEDALYEDADGRLRGYDGTSVILPDDSTALTYMALVVLAIVAIGVMFKTANRTHLD